MGMRFTVATPGPGASKAFSLMQLLQITMISITQWMQAITGPSFYSGMLCSRPKPHILNTWLPNWRIRKRSRKPPNSQRKKIDLFVLQFGRFILTKRAVKIIQIRSNLFTTSTDCLFRYNFLDLDCRFTLNHFNHFTFSRWPHNLHPGLLLLANLLHSHDRCLFPFVVLRLSFLSVNYHALDFRLRSQARMTHSTIVSFRN